MQKKLCVTQTKPSDKFTLNLLVYWYKQISNLDYVCDEKLQMCHVSAECKIIETNPSSFAILYMGCIFNVIKVSIIMRGILHGADESSAY